jgi:hypothetical protein
MATLINNNTAVNFKFGGSLDSDQIKSILAGNGGNRATDEQIREYLSNEGWQVKEIDEFIDFANSELIDQMCL